MLSARRKELLEKRAKLQIRIRFTEFVKDYVDPFLEILDQLQALKIEHRVLSFRCIPEEFNETLREYVQTEALVKYNLAEIPTMKEDQEVEQILEGFPGSNPFRYVLDASVVGFGDQVGDVLREIVQRHQLAEEKVNICWLKYVFLLEADLQDLVLNANDEMFNSWHADSLIFPKDCSWLIAYSLEDEWRFAKSSNKQALKARQP